MSSKRNRKKKKLHKVEYVEAEINIMPFVDVFSILNTFLLFSAVFLAIGIIKVQVPFFTNKDVPEKAKRVLEVKVEVEKDNVMVRTNYSSPPMNDQQWKFNLDEKGLADMHSRLMEVRRGEPDTDTVTVFSEDEVTFEQLTGVLDSVKLLKQGEQGFKSKDADTSEEKSESFLYPKIVIGSVVL